jgi:hypothetical protein
MKEARPLNTEIRPASSACSSPARGRRWASSAPCIAPTRRLDDAFVAVIIPIYDIIVMLEIIKRPVWRFLLVLVPGVNVVIMIILYMDFAE